MSLIEKAVQRLAELKRAGIDVRSEDDGETPGNAPRAVERQSTIEALVDMKGPSELRIGERSRSDAAVLGADATARAGWAPAEPPRPLRRIDLNLVLLEQHGFIHPEKPESARAREFRAVKRPIIRNAMGSSGRKVANGRLVMVTSAVPKEGKTYVAANLAISIAMEVDLKVILVDGDVANPSLCEALRVPFSPGLLDLLTRDDIRLDEAMLQTNVSGLSVLPSGERDRRATELIASERMGQLLREINQTYPDHIVVFDSPPLLATSEAPVLAAQMGQVILTVAADSTTSHLVKQALALLEPCDVVMMLLNKAGENELRSYYGYYGKESPQ